MTLVALESSAGAGDPVSLSTAQRDVLQLLVDLAGGRPNVVTDEELRRFIGARAARAHLDAFAGLGLVQLDHRRLHVVVRAAAVDALRG